LLDLILGILLGAFEDGHTFLRLDVRSLEVRVLVALFKGVIRDHALDEGVHEVIKAAVAFAKEELPLQDMMPSTVCALVNGKRE
jgi:hypothetical protein